MYLYSSVCVCTISIRYTRAKIIYNTSRSLTVLDIMIAEILFRYTIWLHCLTNCVVLCESSGYTGRGRHLSVSLFQYSDDYMSYDV